MKNSDFLVIAHRTVQFSIFYSKVGKNVNYVGSAKKIVSCSSIDKVTCNQRLAVTSKFFGGLVSAISYGSS